jgi:Ca2+/Na+ antiporter
VLEEEDMDGHSSHGSIIDFPKVSPGSLSGYLQIIAHCLLLPLKFLFYHTLPNVTATTAGSKAREKYLLCLVMSIVWLAALSFVMISCCDAIGSFIGASPIVMGLTLSAIGTSFPNLWSSMLVARQGLGDMAVGNAFGSNTFNICIALGMPWLTRAVVTDFSSYRKMEDDGIVFMLLLLVLVAVIFYFTVMLHGWQIRKWSDLSLSPHLTSSLSSGWLIILW